MKYIVVLSVIIIGMLGAVMLVLARQKAQRAKRVQVESFDMGERLERVLNGSANTQETENHEE
ncbi:MAG: hypothetical protein KAT93_05360 [Desulfuromonadales bacterium]|nr:hypothetical protein [Desulfuromonadales bacterium]